MPYNNTPIPPPAEITGQVSLPLARVKKIIAADDDINACSANAAFAIAVAAEQFVYYLTEQSYKMLKTEKKPKRQLAYSHVNAAVSRHDNLEFLSDVVPRQVTYKEAKTIRAQKKARETASSGLQQQKREATASVSNGAAVLNGQPSSSSATGIPVRGAASATPVNGHSTSVVPAPPPGEADEDEMQVDEGEGEGGVRV